MTATPELTDLQRRILGAIDRGARGVSGVAEELGVSERNVKRSIVSLGRKLQVPVDRMPGKARELGARF